ncbi:MAG: hypothetical protein ACRCWR_13545, partial [Saezia sp.]
MKEVNTMLVELTIKNFRSIKDEQSFIFYAGDYKGEDGNKNNKVDENEISPEDNGLIENIAYLPKEEKGAIGVLKVAALYGANA